METKQVPIIGPIFAWLQGEDMDYGLIAAVLGFFLIILAISYIDVPQSKIVSFLFATSPIWLLYITFHIFFEKWMDMVGAAFYLKNGRTTMEIRLPAEVFKSPEAMENVISQIHNTANPDNLMQTYLQGKRPLPISLELVSTGGDVKLYVNTPTSKTKDAFQVNMYAQYPGVEIKELAVDYTAEIPATIEGYELMTFHMQKKKDQEFPIKTYIDFGLHDLPKEEEKLDPMTPMLELLGSIKPYERLWVQIIIKAHREESFKMGQLHHQPTWDTGVREKIDELMGRDPKTKTGPAEFEAMPRMTPGERDTVEAMERNVDKYAYETSIRWVYITKPGHFNGDLINPMIRAFSQYDLRGRNSIGVRWRTDFNYMAIADPFGTRMPGIKRQELKEYKIRSLYPKSQAMGSKIFTTEELATMFHIPGSVAHTPNLARIPSTRSEAPNNLPVGELPTH